MRRSRIEEEKKVIEQMIHIYCRWNMDDHGICDSCRQLLEYAHERLDRCPYGETKNTCRKCPIHCYNREMKQRIQQVMRFAGPRMLFYHPIVAVRHLIREHKRINPLP